MNRNGRSRSLLGPVTLLCAIAFMSFTISTLAQQASQVLRHHVPTVVSNRQAALVGHVPSTQPLHLAIILPLRDQAALHDLLIQLYDPRSPNYRQFLTVGQFAEQFGPTVDDYQTVVDFAKANGFTVEPAPPNRLLVDIDGTVAQIEKAFHVSINIYKHPTENRAFFSPDREPSLDLRVPVKHVAGLDNYSIPQPALTKASTAAQTTASATGSGPGSFFIPSDMRAAYYGAGSLTGSGQCVGLAEFGGYLISDVTSTLAPPAGPNTATWSQNGSTYTVTYTTGGVQYIIPVNNPSFNGYQPVGDTGDAGEQALDIAQAIGMAPGLSQIRVYTAPNNFVSSGNYTYPAGSPQYDWDIFNAMATDSSPCHQLSLSWHWEPVNTSNSPDEQIFEEFQAQGQSFFAASGDWGAFPTPADYYYPAESANITVVGGTSLATAGPGGPWSSEPAWGGANQSCSQYLGTPYASSGGISPDGIPIPSYQQLSGVINASNQGSTLYRNVPDVAAQADCVNYYCDQGVCSNNPGGYPVGGTSYAAPRWAGFMALVNQQAAADGNSLGVGFINNYIYPIGTGSSYNTDFHDTTSGNNYCYDVGGAINSLCGQTVYYNAVTGYDLVTGWGSPNGQALIDDLAGGSGGPPPPPSTDYTLLNNEWCSQCTTEQCIAMPVVAGAFSGNPWPLFADNYFNTLYNGPWEWPADYADFNGGSSACAFNQGYCDGNENAPVPPSGTQAIIVQACNASGICASPAFAFPNVPVSSTSPVTVYMSAAELSLGDVGGGSGTGVWLTLTTSGGGTVTPILQNETTPCYGDSNMTPLPNGFNYSITYEGMSGGVIFDNCSGYGIPTGYGMFPDFIGDSSISLSMIPSYPYYEVWPMYVGPMVNQAVVKGITNLNQIQVTLYATHGNEFDGFIWAATN